jgi:hypothetical protein
MGKLGKSLKRKRLAEDVTDNSGSDILDILDQDLSLSVLALDMLSRRLDLFSSPRLKALRVLLYPILREQSDRNAHFELPVWSGLSPPTDEEAADVIGPSSPTLLSLIKLVSGPLSNAGWKEILASSRLKPFRRALHPLLLAKNRQEGKVATSLHGLSSKVSDAFRRHEWSTVIRLLRQMEATSEVPKLGSMQRWVRDCDLAAQSERVSSQVLQNQNHKEERDDEDENNKVVGGNDGLQVSNESSYSSPCTERSRGNNTALLLLDAIMRANIGKSVNNKTIDDYSKTSSIQSDPLSQKASVIRTPMFKISESESVPTSTTIKDNDSLKGEQDVLEQIVSKESVLKNVTVLSFVKGPDRRPPADDDLYIYSISPEILNLKTTSLPLRLPTAVMSDVKRYAVPLVPGAFVLDNVVSKEECRMIMHIADSIGFQRDGIDGIGALVWLADPTAVLGALFDRVQALLPQEINGCSLMGLNARFRLFRYSPNVVYRPHIDGSWPGSGLTSDGKFTNDAFPGERISRLTFLIYLNDGFDGGATTFFLPSPERGHLFAHSVQPKQGSVLCFPHGEHAGALVHEGSSVEPGGVKYIIRTDVLYSTKIR